MQVILGPYGFCAGVKMAVDIALSTTFEDKIVYVNHPLIHNDIVNEELRKKGVRVLEGTPKRGDTVIISAHGCGKEESERYKQLGCNVIDATCLSVKAIHQNIIEKEKEGFGIIIIGDASHTEIKGTAGVCRSFQIIADSEDLDFSKGDKFFVTVQTTFSFREYNRIKKNIEEKAKKLSKTVEFYDSICYTTVDRQIKAEELARECDSILIVGDKKSANCSLLYKIARQNCENVCFIESLADLHAACIKKEGKTGILSGASTPKELTMEVFERMNELNVNEKAETVVESAENAEAEVAVAETAEKATEKKATEDSEEKRQADKNADEEAMSKLLKQNMPKSYHEGMKVKTHVVKADATGITVAIDDLLGKNDCGFITKEEAELDGSYDETAYKADDEIYAVVIPKEPGNREKTTINLSKKRYDALKKADEQVRKILDGEDFVLACTKAVNGGLTGKIGTYSVFVPASQIKIGYVKNLEPYVGKPLRLRMLPPKVELDEEGNPKKPRNPKKIYASQKVILIEEKSRKEDEFWSGIQEGAIVAGKVKRFADFGAFVNLGYMDALCHNSDLSWSKKRINNPGEVLELNKSYNFIVLSASREEGRIALGYKQLQKRPIDTAREKYPVGSVVRGKVVRITKFGAFVELEPDIDGLVHISQINRGWVQNANEVLKEGEEVDVKVMSYDNDKITLSIKELLPPETAASNDEDIDDEKPPRNTARKTSSNAVDRKETKNRRERTSVADEISGPREYVSGTSDVTIGDIFKLNHNGSEE